MFFEDLLHPLVTTLFLPFKEAYIANAVRKSISDMPVPGTYLLKHGP